jgi:hypothetical protein
MREKLAVSSRTRTLEEAMANLPELLKDARQSAQHILSADGRYAVQFERKTDLSLEDLLNEPGPLADDDVDQL